MNYNNKKEHTMKAAYKEIKAATKFGPIKSRQISEYICMNLSPFFSMIFIKYNLRPNTVTLFMIVSGFLGACCFALPNTIFKVIGILLLFFWFIMDCSDGEVARATKQFSKYGKEMDYMAHLLDHPASNLAMWITYIQIGTYNIYTISALFIILISVELMTRNMISMAVYNKGNNMGKVEQYNPSWLKWFFLQLVYFPNIVLFLPIVILGDYLGFYESFYVLVFIIAMNVINCLNIYIKQLKLYYISK